MAFDYAKFKELTEMLKKAQFVPMGPDAGGMPPPPPGGDPAAGMPPPDAAGGMPPPDAGMPPPDAAGGMPPPMPPMDPAMMDPAAMGMPDPAAGDVSPNGEPYMKITPTQLSKLFKQFAEVFKSVLGIQGQPGQMTAAAAPAANPQQDAQLAELNAKLDALIHG